MCGTTEVTFQNHYCKYCACFEKRHPFGPFLLLQLLLHRLLLITSTWRSSSTYSDLVKQPVDRNITWIWVPLHLAYSLLFVDCLFLLYHLLIIIHHPALWNRAHGSQNLAWLSILTWQASATTDLVQKKMAREARCCGRGMSTFQELLEVKV